MNVEDLVCGIAGVVTMFAYLPQLFKTLKTKKSGDVSLLSWGITYCSVFCYFVYGQLEGTLPYKVSTSIEIVLCTLTIAVLYKYRNGGKDATNR